jgi:hypothetical protein
MPKQTCQTRRWPPAVIVTTALLLGACSGALTKDDGCGGNNFGRVTLQPGCSALCTDEPCAVYFRMPPGEGEFRVRSPGLPIGEYPAGQTVFLGNFWAGSYTFTVEGTDAAPAHLGVTSTSSGN